MEAVRVITGRGVPLVRSDVDTDQIIPSDWLKRVERTGFGEGLFAEWRENSDFVLNQARYSGASVLVAGPNLEIVVDDERKRVAAPAIDLDVAFELDDFTQYRLLNGLDDVGLSLRHTDAIEAYESTRPGWLPSA